jgi:hypothetical protein
VLAGCATISGQVDDRGRAYERTNEAPVRANLEPSAAEPTIPIFNDRLNTGLGGGRNERAAAATVPVCQADHWQSLLGLSKADVQGKSLPPSSRVVDWGAKVTQDYQPNRLNVQLDQNGRVYRVVCG